MDIKEMTGLELMRAIAEGSLPHPTMAETMGMRMLEIVEGAVTFSARANATHLNPLGGVHGGFAASVLDSVTGCAVHSALEAGVGYGTVDLNIKMVRPVPVDVELVATGRLINLSRSIGIADGELKDRDGKLYAHGSCTCLILRP